MWSSWLEAGQWLMGCGVELVSGSALGVSEPLVYNQRCSETNDKLWSSKGAPVSLRAPTATLAPRAPLAFPEVQALTPPQDSNQAVFEADLWLGSGPHRCEHEASGASRASWATAASGATGASGTSGTSACL